MPESAVGADVVFVELRPRLADRAEVVDIVSAAYDAYDAFERALYAFALGITHSERPPRISSRRVFCGSSARSRPVERPTTSGPGSIGCARTLRPAGVAARRSPRAICPSWSRARSGTKPMQQAPDRWSAAFIDADGPVGADGR